MADKAVLVVGLSCLDAISVVDSYPVEDSDQRCVEARWQKGGNAANTSGVLAVLGAPVEYAGVFGNDFMTDLLRGWFKQENAVITHCQYAVCGTPTSAVIVNRTNGSRTILHHNPGLPEISYEHFKENYLPRLSTFGWIHFEGRNVPQLLKIIPEIRADVENSAIISIELEKSKPEMLQLAPFADVLFVSKEFSRFNGQENMLDSVKHFQTLARQGAIIVCAWGELGACAFDGDSLVASPAFPPPKVIDTLAAGDTFNGAFIFARMKGADLKTSVEFACKVAGAKCGQIGYVGLKKFAENLA